MIQTRLLIGCGLVAALMVMFKIDIEFIRGSYDYTLDSLENKDEKLQSQSFDSLIVQSNDTTNL
jgi:hypothetical protein